MTRDPIPVIDLRQADDYLERHFDSWVTWMHSGRGVMGMPKRSAGISTGGTSKPFEEMLEAVESKIAETVDACVNALVPSQRAAIHHCYLHAVYRFRDSYPYAKALAEAKKHVRTGLVDRHIWMGE